MFRFTIRDVLWLTVVVALCTGWYVHLRAERTEKAKIVAKWAKMNHDFRQQIRAEFGLPAEHVPK